MDNKRILILTHTSSGPLQLRNSRHNVVTCTDATEALGILMGGCSAFGKEDYAKTGKVRPEILMLDSSFLESHEGFELLEIIRKYYSLQSVRIFILDHNISPLDPAVFSRYKVSGKVPFDYNLDELTDVKTPNAAPANGTTGAFLSAGILLNPKELISSAVNLIKSKAIVVSSIKTAVAGKVALAASCAVAVTLVVAPVTLNQNKNKTMPVKTQVTAPKKQTAVKQEPIVVPSSEPVVEEMIVAEKKPARVKTTEVQKPQQVVEEEILPVQKPKRQFSIGVEEDESPMEASVSR